jgi:hypothetical protein
MTKTDPFRTVLTMVVGMLALYLLSGWPRLLPLALVVGLAGVFSARIAVLIDRWWMGLAALLGRFMPVVVLTLVYVAVLLPLAVLNRIFGKRVPLNLRPSSVSNFRIFEHKFTAESLRNPW